MKTPLKPQSIGMAFFDLHCHPGLKTLFLPQDGRQFSAWSNLNPKDHLIGDILESQCSLKMLMQQGDINLICLTLHPPEIGMIDQFLLKIGAATVYKKFLSRDRLNEMITLTSSYQQTFAQEFANISAAPRPEDQIEAGKKIKFLKNWNEYQATDFNTLHIVFNIEGAHTFYDLNNRVKDIEQVVGNFNSFISKGFRVLYFTLAHLTPNEFITHAYGNKLLTKGPLLPKGIGITAFGKRMIENAYAKKVFIDVKHMSLVSRRIFYLFRKKHFPDMPIIASHIGLTGESWTVFRKDRNMVINPVRKSYGYKLTWLKNRGKLEGTDFYPLSINLYNEDITEILGSKGLIGISLDLRILGGKDKTGALQSDFYSHEEYELLTAPDADQQIQALSEQFDIGQINNGNTTLNLVNPEPQDIEDLKEADAELQQIFASKKKTDLSADYRYHVRLVLNHIIRIWEITDWYGMPAPWDHLCIGSDFDGMIAAVACFRNSTEAATFALALKTELELELPHYPDINLTAGEIVDRLMFQNAKAFLEKYF